MAFVDYLQLINPLKKMSRNGVVGTRHLRFDLQHQEFKENWGERKVIDNLQVIKEVMDGMKKRA